MLTSGFGPATRLSLGAMTLIALIVAAMGALHARQANAANGDPVLVYGGSVAGSGAQDVTIAPGGSGNYVVSMTVPAGEDIGGIYVKVAYNATPFSSVTCSVGTVPAAAQIVCNPTATPGEARIIAVNVTNPPPAGFASGTFTLATLTFNVAGAAADLANAVTNITVEGCEPVGSPGDTAVTCGAPVRKNLVIDAGGGGGVWGDINCSGVVNAADANLVKRASAGLPITQPVGCTTPTDINCSGVTNAADANLAKRMASGLPVTLPVGCPPGGFTLPAGALAMAANTLEQRWLISPHGQLLENASRADWRNA